MHLNPPPLPVRIRFPSSKQTIEFLLTPPENKLEKYTHSSSSGHRVRSLFFPILVVKVSGHVISNKTKKYTGSRWKPFSLCRGFFLKVKMRIPKNPIGVVVYRETPGPLDPPSIIPPGKRTTLPPKRKTLYGIHRFITFTTSKHKKSLTTTTRFLIINLEETYTNFLKAFGRFEDEKLF
jgi:hypothetical protein